MATAARSGTKGGGAVAPKRKPGPAKVIPFPGAAAPPPPAPYVEPAPKPGLLARLFGGAPKPVMSRVAKPLEPGVYRDIFGRQTFVPAPAMPAGTWHWKAKPVTKGTTVKGTYYRAAKINKIARKPMGQITRAEWDVLVAAGITPRLAP